MKHTYLLVICALSLMGCQRDQDSQQSEAVTTTSQSQPFEQITYAPPSWIYHASHDQMRQTASTWATLQSTNEVNLPLPWNRYPVSLELQVVEVIGLP